MPIKTKLIPDGFKSGSLRSLAMAVHQNAKTKGFYAKRQSEDAFVERTCNNMHDEISELHEAWRNGNLRNLCDKADKMKVLGILPLTCLEEELADVVIRALDTAEHLNVDIESAVFRKHAFNTTRPIRHGNKKS